MGIQKHRRPTIAPDSDGVYQDVSGGGGGAGEIDRTGTETLAGFTSLEGDAVYQKTIAIPAGPTNETVNVAHGITGMKALINAELFFDNASLWRTVMNVEAIQATACMWHLTATNIVLFTGATGVYAGYSGEATLFYTKTA